MKKNREKAFIFTCIPLWLFLKLAGLIIGGWILYSGIKFFLPFDISQDYRKVQGIENIIFGRSWEQQCYKRVFWGLQKIEDSQTDYSEICWESDDSEHELLDCIDTDNSIWRSVYSPDKKYILYCEIEHKSGVTDDEYCYYRVYEIETGKIITIYQAYKEWYNLAWLDLAALESWGSFTAEQTYSYDNKYYAIQEVEEDPNGGGKNINVCIYETETDTLVYMFCPARARDFWGICWENDTYNIWTQSADIGIYCYKYEDMQWQRDESAQRPEYIISKYDK